jgi:hypothetical protein
MGIDITLRSVLSDEAAIAIVDREVIAHPARGGELMEAVFSAWTATGGYFRDPYNNWGLLMILGIKIGQFVSGNEVSVEAARFLLAELEHQPITPDLVDRALYGPNLGVHAMEEEMGLREPRSGAVDDADRERAQGWFTDKRDNLMALLRRSIALNEPLHCEY